MARYGITREAVFEVADTLWAAGENPTIERVRRELGTGSHTYINKYLREWKTARIQQPNPLLKRREGTPDAIRRIIEDVWDKLTTESQNEVEQAQMAAKEAVVQAQQHQQALEEKIQLLQAQLEKAQLSNNHLQADLKLKTGEWKTEREQRIGFEARTQESEKNLHYLQEETNKRFAELERAHQETLNHIKEQQIIAEKEYKKTIEEFKTITENQRQKYMVEVDQLKTAKNKLEQEKLKLTVELEQHIKRHQALEERAKGWEFDLQLAQQNHQANEKELIVLQTEMKQKETAISELKTQIAHWQQRFETATEHIGQLKAQVEKQR